MPRKGPIPKREILPDPKYGNLKLSKFINNLMERGKKSTAEKIIYSALDEISSKAKRDPLEIFEEALDQVGPQVEVKSRRVGGATYQVPLEVKSSRKMALAMRWLVNSAKNRSEKICRQNWRMNFLMLLKEKAKLLRKDKIHTKWLKQIKPFLTSDFKCLIVIFH